MGDGLFLAVMLGAVVVMIYLAWLVISRWRKAARDRGRLKWLHAQLERAFQQIHSDDEQEILAGLQILAILRDPSVRVRALERIDSLTKSENQLIARHAKSLYSRILEELSKLAKPVARPLGGGNGKPVSTA